MNIKSVLYITVLLNPSDSFPKSYPNSVPKSVSELHSTYDKIKKDVKYWSMFNKLQVVVTEWLRCLSLNTGVVGSSPT